MINVAERGTLFVTAACVLGMLAGTATIAGAQPRIEVRGFWVDTFNTTLNNHADVATVVDRALAANANTIFAQVRRRGDSWYLNSLEPPADRTPIQPGFDPLQDLIVEAHGRGLEVHAYVIANAIWSRAPNLFPPEDPNHVFNRHGGYDPATNTITPGPDNWLTRTLIPDGTAGTGISLQGHRFVSEFYIDPGHPDAARYTAEVLTHLVRNYEVDGLHLDRIRYPEITIPGQTPSTGTSVGYNPASIARFQRRYAIPSDSPPPAQNDPRWNQWRRDQVTNLVRRVYLDSVAIRPGIKLSGSYIAFGSGPLTESRLALRRSVLARLSGLASVDRGGHRRHRDADDLPARSPDGGTHGVRPVERVGAQPPVRALRRHGHRLVPQRGRRHPDAGASCARALGARTSEPRRDIFLDGDEQRGGRGQPAVRFRPGRTRRSGRLPTSRRAWSPGAQPTARRCCEDPAANPVPVFDQPAAIPDLSWKTDPQVGHLRGVIRDESGEVVDTGDVTVSRVGTGPPPGAGRSSAAGATDGNGYYGAIDLAPGVPT